MKLKRRALPPYVAHLILVRGMKRSLATLVFFVFATWIPAQPSPASAAPTPRMPRIDGNVRAVSAADIRTVLALIPVHFTERHCTPVPITFLYIVDHHTMEVHYSPSTFTYARRAKGHWRIDYADTERVKVDSSYIPG